MKRTAYLGGFDSTNEKIKVESTGIKGLYGETLWVDENGTYYYLRNNGHHAISRMVNRSQIWVAFKVGKEYLKRLNIEV